ncbi:MAG: nitroreductase family protein [Chloroflexi bacterium]|nr:nitroreductase family protein [Chloroflexota bacterium]
MDVDALLDVMRHRRTVRLYRQDPVSDEQIEKIIEAARWAPSGANTQPCEFVVVRDRDKISALADLWIEWNRLTIENDPTFHPTKKEYLKIIPVIIAVLGDSRCRRVMPRIDAESPHIIYQHSMAAAIQNMHLAAAAQGLGSVWLSAEPFMQEPIRELLNIPPIFDVPVVVPVGYPVKQQEGRRRELAKIVHHDSYEASKLRDAAGFAEYLPSDRARRALE